MDKTLGPISWEQGVPAPHQDPAQDSSARKISPHNFWLQKPVGIESVEETVRVPSSSPYRTHTWTKSDSLTLSSSSFFHQLNPHWFLQPEVVGTYLPGTGTLGWGAWYGVGLFTPDVSLLSFYPSHVVVGPAHSASVPVLPV